MSRYKPFRPIASRSASRPRSRVPIALCLCLSLGALGCSRGGAAVPDSENPDLAEPSSRIDLAGADLAAQPDLGANLSCPAPCWLNPLPQGNNLSAVWREPSGDGWAVGFGPSMVRLEGGRLRLVRPAFADKQYWYTGVWGSGPSDVWAVGPSAVVHYDGKDWTETPLEAGVYLGLSAVWGSGPKDVWLVSANGAIHHHDGTGWQTVASSTMRNLRSIHGTASNNVFAVGDGGTIVRWDGTAWKTQPVVVGSDLTKVRCASATDCLAFGSLTTVLRWDGSKWSQVKTTGIYSTMAGLLALGPANYLISGSDAGGAHTLRYDGKTFTQLPTSELYMNDLAGTSGDDVIGVGGRGLVAAWNGLSWTSKTLGSVESTAAMWAQSPSDLWLATYSSNGGHLVHWDGARFAAYDTLARITYEGIWGSDTSNVWAVGYEGNIAKWDGARWALEPKVTTENLMAIAGSSKSQIWVSATGGVMLRYDGSKWTAQPSLGSGIAMRGLWMASASDGWGAGTSAGKGTLWRCDGSKWTAWPKQFDQPLATVWGSGVNDVWAAGDKGLVVHFDGTEWRQFTSPSTSDAYVMGGSGPTDVWLTAYMGMAYHYNGAYWSSVFTDTRNSLRGIYSSGTQVLAAGEYGTLLRLSP